jgi:hypothetical protein
MSQLKQPRMTELRDKKAKPEIARPQKTYLIRLGKIQFADGSVWGPVPGNSCG